MFFPFAPRSLLRTCEGEGHQDTIIPPPPNWRVKEENVCARAKTSPTERNYKEGSPKKLYISKPNPALRPLLNLCHAVKWNIKDRVVNPHSVANYSGSICGFVIGVVRPRRKVLYEHFCCSGHLARDDLCVAP